MSTATFRLTVDFPVFVRRIEAILAGLEARVYVQGAMDPDYSDPVARDARCRDLLTASETLAAEFLRGWVEHRDTSPATLDDAVWYRLLGDTRIEVTRS